VNVELRAQGPKPRKGRAPTTVLEMVVDADDTFVGLLNNTYNSGRTPTLDKINPYANVILSGPEVRQFADELAALWSYASSAAERQQLAAIEALAKKCLDRGSECHLYFVGD
jgi:hypothetical protein